MLRGICAARLVTIGAYDCGFRGRTGEADHSVEPAASGAVIHVHNPSAQPLTALFLATAETPFWEKEFRDPVPGGGDQQFDFPHPWNATVQAAVYGDGFWAADDQLRPRLMEQRNLTLTTARDLRKMLLKAQQTNVPEATLEGDLKIQSAGLKTQPDRAASRQLILDTIAQLQATKSFSDVLLDLLKEESNIATGQSALR